MTDVSCKTNSGKYEILHIFFDKSLIGFSQEKFGPIYYTIPFDNIISFFKTDDINTLFTYTKHLYEKSNYLVVIPVLFTLDFNTDISLNSLSNIFSKVKLISKKTSLFSSQKSFSFSIPSNSIRDAFDILLHTETQEEKKIKSYLLNFVDFQNCDYFLDIELKDNMLQKVMCITPSRGGCAYYFQVDFNYPCLNLTLGSISGQVQKCMITANSKLYEASGDRTLEVSISGGFLGKRNNSIVFDMFPDKSRLNRNYKEKSIYSLTLGELFELCKVFTDT